MVVVDVIVVELLLVARARALSVWLFSRQFHFFQQISDESLVEDDVTTHDFAVDHRKARAGNPHRHALIDDLGFELLKPAPLAHGMAARRKDTHVRRHLLPLECVVAHLTREAAIRLEMQPGCGSLRLFPDGCLAHRNSSFRQQLLCIFVVQLRQRLVIPLHFLQELTGHLDQVQCVACNPMANRTTACQVFSGGKDQQILAWTPLPGRMPGTAPTSRHRRMARDAGDVDEGAALDYNPFDADADMHFAGLGQAIERAGGDADSGDGGGVGGGLGMDEAPSTDEEDEWSDYY